MARHCAFSNLKGTRFCLVEAIAEISRVLRIDIDTASFAAVRNLSTFELGTPTLEETL